LLEKRLWKQKHRHCVAVFTILEASPQIEMCEANLATNSER
jgi:hypothetical protein